ncbi:MOP flippase family protein [Cognaticolwellia mytili]|uniref:MOP flippase family protein n=1 Tax=Cognaticolwellia mytili TaxID=1888913 RepID=UPI000A175834|nr:MOP flippase family protein [Cognaticolwellia mytili]
MTIAKSAFAGVSWSAISTLYKGALQLLQLIILARFLTPVELGLLALINLVIGFAQIFGDAGISNSLIFHQNLKRSQLNQLYLINVVLGLTMTAIMLLLSYPLAMFFSLPRLTELLLLLSPIFLIRSLSQQHIALLQQKLQFNAIAKIEMIASTMAFIVLLILLYLGERVESVVFSQLVNATVLTGVTLFLHRSLMPTFEKVNWPSVIKPVKYGLYQTGEGLLNYISSQFDQLLIGKLLGAETLGIYAYIKELVFRPAMQVINPIVNRVTFPLMVKYKQEHSLSGIYYQIIHLLSLINVPLYLLMASFPGVILELIFGASWVAHAELMRWLALYMLLISLINPIGTLLKATGEVKRSFYWNLVTIAIRPLLIITSIASGVIVLVKVLVAAQIVILLMHWCFLIRPVISMSVIKFLSAILLPLSLFLLASVSVFLINQYVISINDFYIMLIIAVSYCLLIIPSIIKVISFIRK